MSRRHRIQLLAVALTVAAAAAGCATTVSGRGQAAAAPKTPASSSSADFPTVAPTIAPTLPATPSTSSAAPLGSQDITDVHWRIPRGFVKAHGYHPVTPLEHNWRSGYLVPSNERNGLDVLSVVLYRLPSYIPVNTLFAQKTRVRYYNDRAGAHAQSGLHVNVVAGRPAIQENAIEQGKYKYAAWFVFGSHHVLDVSCQVDQQVDKIIRGCDALLKSLKLSS